jgi:hypothetical protein
MFWLQKHIQQPLLQSTTLRRFGGAHGQGHHDDHHGDHHDDHGHHQHVVKPDPTHRFINGENSDKRFLVFNGLKATDSATIVLDNPFKHLNDLPLYK